MVTHRIIRLAVFSLFVQGTIFCQPSQDNIMVGNIDRLVDKMFAIDMTPGLAVCIVKGNVLLYAKGFGFADVENRRPVTTETLFYIASTTKSFTGLAATLLHHSGKIHFDSSMHYYLPSVRLQPPLSPDSISVRALLTHTHGIQNDGPVVFRTAFSGEYTKTQLLELLVKHKPSPTGRFFSYGNLGYNIAGFVMEEATHASWKDLVRQQVFEPLGMTSTRASLSGIDEKRLAMPYAALGTGYQRLPYSKSDANMHAAGGHVSTVLDLAKWFIVQINMGKVGGKQVFPANVVAETHAIQAIQDRNFAMFHRFGWGIGWDLGTYEGDTLIHRFGSFPGFRSHVSFMPQYNIGVAILVNESSLGSFLCDVVASSIYDELLQKAERGKKLAATLAGLEENARKGRIAIAEHMAARAARPQTLPYPLTMYTGTFENGELGKMKWLVVDGRLEARIGLARSSVEVYNGQENKFRVELTGGGEIVAFMIQEGKVSGLTYSGREFTRKVNSSKD